MKVDEISYILLYLNRTEEAWPLYERRFAANKLPRFETVLREVW